ncbi:MAG: ornithine carbamoyltransferase [Acidimicrobiia bacterium]
MMDFVNVLDMGSDGIAHVVELAAKIKADPSSVAGTRSGLRVGLFFEKPSTRTRVSCEVGTAELGAQPIVLKNDEVGLGTREAPQDVARVLERYLDVLAFRVFDHRNLVLMAEHAEAPVINLLSDREHPCQAIADLVTVAEHRPLKGATIAYVGDGNNVAHSLMLAASAVGTSVTVAAPVGYEPDEAITELARSGAVGGAEIRVTNDPIAAVVGVDAVYTDVWTSMGSESEAEERRSLFEPFRVTEELFESAGSEAIFMHCLPAHRGEEVTDGVVDHERSRVFDQAENRLHAFKAILLHLTA